MTLTGFVRFPVYTPGVGSGWSQYQARAWAVPFVWLLWLARGLRTRIMGPPLGRAVRVEDMLAFHPGKPAKCLCRGSGVLDVHKQGVRGVSFCAKMLGAFREHAGFRVAQHRRTGAPHWVRGMAPEEMVGTARGVRR